MEAAGALVSASRVGAVMVLLRWRRHAPVGVHVAGAGVVELVDTGDVQSSRAVAGRGSFGAPARCFCAGWVQPVTEPRAAGP